MQVVQTVAPPEYWDGLYDRRTLTYDEDSVLFKDLFAKYLSPGGTCFEVGCYPGGFLIYLGKTFGYTVGGIDTTPAVSTALPELIRSHGLEISDLAQGNFFTYQPEQKFDLVCSFGFIEHFPNYQEVIRRHADLVKPGGMLVISCPNFRWFQKAYHRLFDAVNLRRHVLPAMNFGKWRATLTQCEMEIVHQSYYGTCEVWREKDGKHRPIRDRVADRLIRLSRRLDARISYPNRYTSPYMIMFARKPAANSPEGANGTGRG